MPRQVLPMGVTSKSHDAEPLGVPPTNGQVYVLQQRHDSRGARSLTWRTSFTGGTPSAVNVVLQGTLDPSSDADADWFTLDTSTNTAGEQRTVAAVSVAAVRTRKVSQTGAASLTTQILG